MSGIKSALPYLLALPLLSAACNSSQIGGGEVDMGTVEEDAGVADLTPPFDRDAACGMVKAQATLTKAPVDVIFVIDNSGSMSAEITAVQNNINNSFAKIIAASGIDYRIIMISRHGSAANSQSVCISAPLSGIANCTTPPGQPVNTANFFHYSVEIGSTNALTQLTATYNVKDEFNLAPNGWQAWLRPGAVKTFISITDDETAQTAAAFDTALLALTPKNFGTAAARNYVFHAIMGIVQKAVPTTAYQPTEATVNTACSTAQNAGPKWQDLAKLTKGLRYPVCQTANYDAVFNEVATGVIKGAKVSCDFNVPTAPPGKQFDLKTAQLQYTPGNGGAPRIFKQVTDAASCTPDSFYILNGRVNLCGDSCTTVQADDGATLEFLLDCYISVG